MADTIIRNSEFHITFIVLEKKGGRGSSVKNLQDVNCGDEESNKSHKWDLEFIPGKT